ncbi:hypothetical protein ACOMHN_008202 [Nucella lapillus]
MMQQVLPFTLSLELCADSSRECGAFCFKDESKGFCCSNGLISLDAFPPPPPFLGQLLDSTDNASMDFKKNIRYYNNAFQITSFGYHEAAVPGWNPTIRVQGQVYHLIGTLLPHNINTPSFLQVYFIDSLEEEVAIRQNKELHRGILRQLIEIMHANNSYVQNLKSAKDELLAEKNMKVIIREDKRPQGEHSRRFNKQQSSEIAILMDNEPTATRDIVLRLKDGGLKRISELHRSYDPLQQQRNVRKQFPKAFHATTDQHEDSYPKYRRRSEEDGGHVGKLKDSVIITNQWVVPYNPYLLHQFNCHINVEICSSIKSIKYVLKYVHKGTDQAIFQLQKAGTAQQEDHQQNNVDEISMFQNAQYIGSIEAGWRLLGNDIHERFPMVQRLCIWKTVSVCTFDRTMLWIVHMGPFQQRLSLHFSSFAMRIRLPSNLNTQRSQNRTWKLTRKQWQKRKRGKAIGRMYTISPRQGECYFLRLLLNVVKGPKSYDDLKTVNGEVCATFREACQKQSLLEDDQHLQLAMEEACANQSPKLLQDLLAIILMSCNPSQPGHLRVNFRDHLAEDFLISFRREDKKLPDSHVVGAKAGN